jgi:hypothetical protein
METVISGPPPRGTIPRRQRGGGGVQAEPAGNGNGWDGGIERHADKPHPPKTRRAGTSQLEVEQSDLRIDVIVEDDGVMILAEIPVSDSDGVRVSRRERKVRLATGGGRKAEAELPREVSGKPTRRRLRNGAPEVRYAKGS